FARSALPLVTSATTRSTRAVVLPEPAPASTNSVDSRSVAMRSRAIWSGNGVARAGVPRAGVPRAGVPSADVSRAGTRWPDVSMAGVGSSGTADLRRLPRPGMGLGVGLGVGVGQGLRQVGEVGEHRVAPLAAPAPPQLDHTQVVGITEPAFD